MKQIEPVQIWTNGVSKTAEYLQVTGINDNYESAAVNYWQLFTKVEDANNFYLNANIAVSMVYNIGLNSSEVLQNFNAQKTRYGY